MKKIFLWFVAALCGMNVSAQTLNEGFEGEQFPPEGFETANANANANAVKVLRDGQILILRGDAVYTISGMRIR